jgi:hypothetical protein
MIYVIAGSYEEFIKKKDLSPYEHQYIEDADGLKNIKFYCVGNYWRSPLWHKLYDLVQNHGWQEVNLD